MLSQAYRVEVETRGYRYAKDESTRDRLSKIARWLTDSSKKPSLLLYGTQLGTGKSTTAKAIRRMIIDLHSSMEESIILARESLWEKEKAQFAEWPIPWPEGVGPETFAGRDGFRRRQEWERKHPEESKAIREAEAKKYEASAIWRRPYETEIEGARLLADKLAQMKPKYTTAIELSNLVRADDRPEYNTLVNSAFLIVDDIGTEPEGVKAFGTELLPIADLIMQRYDSRFPTIITTNLSEKGIAEAYGVRVMDRLNEICEKVPYGGESYRR